MELCITENKEVRLDFIDWFTAMEVNRTYCHSELDGCMCTCRLLGRLVKKELEAGIHWTQKLRNS